MAALLYPLNRPGRFARVPETGTILPQTIENLSVNSLRAPVSGAASALEDEG
jgi:hypothetical protein